MGRSANGEEAGALNEVNEEDPLFARLSFVYPSSSSAPLAASSSSAANFLRSPFNGAAFKDHLALGPLWLQSSLSLALQLASSSGDFSHPL